jgi:hypothetical protein
VKLRLDAAMKIGFVALERIHPPVTGGRVRMAGIVSALEMAGHTVSVFDPEEYGLHPRVRSPRHFLRIAPRQGAIRVSSAMQKALQDSDLDLIVLSISYLAPFISASVPVVIDFQNIESERFASIARNSRGLHKVSARLESLKARWWEPRAARRADVCLACTPEEADILTAWGAEVRTVPHSADIVEAVSLTGEVPVVLFLGSAGYKPNDDAGRWLVGDIWPRVKRGFPSAELRIVGRGTAEAYDWVDDPTIRVVGEVESVTEELVRSCVTVAPVRSGAGAQLKVVTALAHGRAMVATSYSLRSVPAQIRAAVSVGDDAEVFASKVIELLSDRRLRHERELLLAGAGWGWSTAAQPLVDWVDGQARRTR